MLEAAKATTETVDALRTGASAMKAMHKSTYVTSHNTKPLESIIMLLSFSWIFTNVCNSLMSSKQIVNRLHQSEKFNHHSLNHGSS